MPNFDCSKVHHMALTLAEAAQACGINRSTVLRAIKSGKISGSRDASGAWTVEAVELHRVFPPVSDVQGKHRAAHQVALVVQTAALETQIVGLQQLNALLREQLDHWREQAQAAQAITQQLNAQAAPAPAPRFWWRGRLAG